MSAPGKRPQMRALCFDGNELKVRDDVSLPRPGSGEALIRVLLAGICNTDLEIAKGYMDFSGIPGHEFVGVVEKSSDKQLQGKRVVGEINCACGKCEYCRGGLHNHCPHRSVLGIVGRDGAFAEYLTLPNANLHVLPDTIDDEAAVFVEPLAAAFRVLSQVHIRPEDKVVVLGDGKLGLLVSQVLNLARCDLITVGKHPGKLAILEDRGISTVLGGQADERQADVVVECTGSPNGLRDAIRFVKPRGTVVLKSTVAEDIEIAFSPLVVDEITVVGSRCGPFAPAIRSLQTGVVDVRSLVTRRYDLDDAMEAMKYASTRGALKVLLHVSEPQETPQVKASRGKRKR